MNIVETLRRIIRFFTYGIWHTNENEVPHLRYLLYNAAKVTILTVRRYTGDSLVTRAAALTYSTILSVVPIFALVFAIARGFGVQNLAEELIREAGIESSTADMLLGFVDSYLSHTRSGVFIVVDVVLLLWTVTSLINNIERNMNFIWQVHKPRSFFRKVTDYSSLLVLIPIVIVSWGGISIFMTTMLRELSGYALISHTLKQLIQVAPYLLSVLIFTAMFIFIPNTKVKFRNAFIPGLLVGVAFQYFQYFYIHSQVGMAKYNAIYGSFAAIPLFLLWANISWMIILFGVQLSYFCQNVKLFSFDKEVSHISRRYHNFICIIVMSLICKRFELGDAPYTAAQLVRETQIPPRLVNQVLYELQLINFIYDKEEDEKSEEMSYLPASDINKMSVALLLDKLETFGSEDFKIDNRCEFAPQWNVSEQSRLCAEESLKSVLLKDLVIEKESL